SNGSLDASFGSGAGRLVTNIANDRVKDLAVQPDGKIVITGDALERVASQVYIGRNIFAIRYNADGTPDTAFGDNGTAKASYRVSTVCPVLNEPHNPEALALQPDGKIIVAGYVAFCDPSPTNGYRGGAAIVRFLPDGQLDNTFDSDGKVLNSDIRSANAVTLQSDGKIIAVGQSGNPYGNPSVPYDFGILRYTTNGTLDTSFDGDGKVVTSIEAYNDIARDVLVQPNGKIVVVGESSVLVTGFTITNFAIARLNSDGSLDSSFDGDGKVITDFNNNSLDSISRAVLQPDGKILAVGATKSSPSSGSPNVLAMARYIGDTPVNRAAQFDFDGDGKSNIAVFRPSNGNWYILPSQNNSFYGFPFGQAGDQIAPADYDGDGKTDVAVFRDTVPGAGNFAYFYILNSSDNSFRPVQFGATDDVPMAGDWDGDGKADLAVYRSGSVAGGQSYFYYRPSSQPSVNYNTIAFGVAGDKPLLGDFDGDGRLDPAVFRPSSASWHILRSSSNQVTQTTFGLSSDIPVPADYDGDGITNIAVFRPSNGTWYTSTNPQNNYGAVQFGTQGDLPVPADYDGDGKADVAVFRPSNGAWYLNRTTNGFTGVQFGASGDKPAPNAFVR
ncbi:MAG: FG-GAP-like repeat-containing protein, partial [Acidobacteriota bacterium]|nr:FG-GAP-like repeat-containing protein [Acidobacteriota bacterium]